MRIGTYGLVALSVSATFLFSSAQATPIAGSMSVTAHVELDANIASDPQNTSWAIIPAPLNLSVSAALSDPSSGASVSASGSGSASWGAGGNSGSVQFTGFGWTTVPGANFYAANLNSGGPDWQYTFIADANGAFSMTYNVVGSGTTFGLQGWDISWSGPGGGVSLLNVNDPTTSGSFSRALIAGQLYVVSLQNNANVSSGGAFPAGSMDGTFDFDITGTTEVPEPGTLALLGAGLIGLAALRRRRKSAPKNA